MDKVQSQWLPLKECALWELLSVSVGWEKGPWGMAHSFHSDLTATYTVSLTLLTTVTLEQLKVLAMEAQRIRKSLNLALGSPNHPFGLAWTRSGSLVTVSRL